MADLFFINHGSIDSQECYPFSLFSVSDDDQSVSFRCQLLELQPRCFLAYLLEADRRCFPKGHFGMAGVSIVALHLENAIVIASASTSEYKRTVYNLHFYTIYESTICILQVTFLDFDNLDSIGIVLSCVYLLQTHKSTGAFHVHGKRCINSC